MTENLILPGQKGFSLVLCSSHPQACHHSNKRCLIWIIMACIWQNSVVCLGFSRGSRDHCLTLGWEVKLGNWGVKMHILGSSGLKESHKVLWFLHTCDACFDFHWNSSITWSALDDCPALRQAWYSISIAFNCSGRGAVGSTPCSLQMAAHSSSLELSVAWRFSDGKSSWDYRRKETADF